MADGYAVKELLKLTSLLYEAMKTKIENDLESLEEEDSPMGHNFDISSKVIYSLLYLTAKYLNI